MGGSLLSTSLLLLDAAENNLTGLTGFPGRSILQVSLSRNHFMDATKGALVQLGSYKRVLAHGLKLSP